MINEPGSGLRRTGFGETIPDRGKPVMTRWHGRGRTHCFGPEARQAPWVTILNVADQALANFAAHIERFAGISGRNQHSDLHRPLGRVGHLQVPKAAVPFLRFFDDPFGFVAQFIESANKKTDPSTLGEVRVQFWNGLSKK